MQRKQYLSKTAKILSTIGGALIGFVGAYLVMEMLSGANYSTLASFLPYIILVSIGLILSILGIVIENKHKQK